MSDTPVETDVVTPTPETLVNKPNPHIIALIVGTTSAFIKDNPKDDSIETLYFTTFEYVKTITEVKTANDLASVLFYYYLEAYRAFIVIRDYAPEPGDIVPPDMLPHLYTDAALSLFDIYLAYPHTLMTRRCLPLATIALHQVVATHQSQVKETPVETLLEYLSMLGLLCQTVGDYVKGRKRSDNYSYIRWLKKIIKMATSTDDLSFLKTDSVVKKVLIQVSNNDRVIHL